MTDEIKNSNDLRKFENRNSTVLGHITWWSTADSKVSRSKLENAFAANQIPESFLPEKINTGRAFKRALSIIEKQSNSGEKHRGLVLTKIVEDGARAVYSIHNRSVDVENEKTSMVEEDQIYFNKSAGTIDYGHKYATEISDLLEGCLEFYTGQDVRNIIRQLILNHAKAITLRDRGSVYFVPEKNKPVFDRIRSMLFDLGIGGDIYDFPIFDGPEKSKIAKLTIEEIQNELFEMRKDVIDSIKNAKYKAALKNRVEKLSQYQAKINMYADLLEFNADDMRAVIAQSRKDLQSALGEGNSFNQPVIKVEETFVQQLERENAEKAKKEAETNYSPVQQVVAITGNIDESEKVEVVKKVQSFEII